MRLEAFLARKERDRETEKLDLSRELEFQQYERERQEVEYEERILFPAQPCESSRVETSPMWSRKSCA